MKKLPPLSEDQFLRQVLQLARLRGWLAHHGRPAWTNKGWRTPIQGDAGFPDLVLVRKQTVIFAELKSESGRCRRNQEVWLNLLRAAGQQVHTWRPSDFPAIQEILENG